MFEGPGGVRSSDPSTSRAAAVADGKALSDRAEARRKVLRYAAFLTRTKGRFSDTDLAGYVSGMDRGVVARRRLDLVQARLVEPLPDPTNGGRQAQAKQNGRPVLLWRCTGMGLREAESR